MDDSVKEQCVKMRLKVFAWDWFKSDEIWG
jgi:hypothetical protein